MPNLSTNSKTYQIFLKILIFALLQNGKKKEKCDEAILKICLNCTVTKYICFERKGQIKPNGCYVKSGSKAH